MAKGQHLGIKTEVFDGLGFRWKAPPSAEIGLMVDSAEEVMQIASGDIEPTPDFGGGIDVA